MSAAPGTRSLEEPWLLGGLVVPNRVLLAPLAGIGNWFVRLQAKRYGAGMAVSEMVSSHAVHYGNRRTIQELLRIDPREREGGPVSIQLFGQDAAVMRSAAETVAEAGADVVDLNMGCPVPKVCKTGAGAALLADQDRAVALARAARLGSGLPVTVKLRSGASAGDRSGLELAVRLVEEAEVSAIAIHARAAAARHSGAPDYELVRELVERLPVPVILTGGLREAGRIRELFERTGAAAVMLARGALGNPWLFAQLTCGRRGGGAATAAADPDASCAQPSRAEIVTELGWVLDRAREHLEAERANRYLRKFYPWYVARLALPRQRAAGLQAALQEAPSLVHARALLAEIDLTEPPGARDQGQVEMAA